MIMANYFDPYTTTPDESMCTLDKFSSGKIDYTHNMHYSRQEKLYSPTCICTSFIKPRVPD